MWFVADNCDSGLNAGGEAGPTRRSRHPLRKVEPSRCNAAIAAAPLTAAPPADGPISPSLRPAAPSGLMEAKTSAAEGLLGSAPPAGVQPCRTPAGADPYGGESAEHLVAEIVRQYPSLSPTMRRAWSSGADPVRMDGALDPRSRDPGTPPPACCPAANAPERLPLWRGGGAAPDDRDGKGADVASGPDGWHKSNFH